MILKNTNMSCRQKQIIPRFFCQLGLEFRSEKQVTSSINRNTFFDSAIEKSPMYS